MVLPFIDGWTLMAGWPLQLVRPLVELFTFFVLELFIPELLLPVLGYLLFL